MCFTDGYVHNKYIQRKTEIREKNTAKAGASPLSVRACELHREKPFPANAVILLTVIMKDLG